MKRYADAKRDDVSFSVGQWVYVRLRPGRQTSVTGPHHPKLSKRFFGPFMFEDRIGFVAYRLRLPPDSQVHPVFHSSLLRAHHGPPPLSTDTWPLGTLTQQPVPPKQTKTSHHQHQTIKTNHTHTHTTTPQQTTSKTHTTPHLINQP